MLSRAAGLHPKIKYKTAMAFENIPSERIHDEGSCCTAASNLVVVVVVTVAAVG